MVDAWRAEEIKSVLIFELDEVVGDRRHVFGKRVAFSARSAVLRLPADAREQATNGEVQARPDKECASGGGD